MKVQSVEIIQKKFFVEIRPKTSEAVEIEVTAKPQVSFVMFGTQGPPGASGETVNIDLTVWFENQLL